MPPFAESYETIEPPCTHTDYYNEVEHLCGNLKQKFPFVTEKNKFHHVCAFFDRKGRTTIMGENMMLNRNTYPLSVHAEVNVMNKLKMTPPHIVNIERTVFDMLVVRISRIGKLGSSRPCYHCLRHLAANNNVRIRYVYYSNHDGTVSREKFEDMVQSKERHISSGHMYRSRGVDRSPEREAERMLVKL